MSDAERRHGTSWQVLRRRDFAIFWSAALISNSGTWMQLIAVPFVMYKMTHSTAWLGIAAVASYVPNMLSSLVGGTYADRHSRKRILVVTQTVLMSLAFLLWLIWSQGWATPGIVVGLNVATGMVAGINITTWQAFVTQLVERDELVDAVRINALQFTGARAFGPALAGLVLQVAGASTAFFLNAASYLLVLGALFVIRPHAQQFAARAGSVTTQVREGFRLARRDTTLFLSIMLITAVSTFGSSNIQLAPAIAKEFFGVGRGAYGLLVAAFGTGAVVGSIAMAFIADRIDRSALTRVALFGMAAGLLLLAVAPHYAVGLTAMFVMGLMYLSATTPISTAIQARVTDAFRARVLSVYLAAFAIGVPLGALVGGKIATYVPLRLVIFGYGLALALVAFVAGIRYDNLRPLDHALDESVEEEAAAEAADATRARPAPPARRPRPAQAFSRLRSPRLRGVPQIVS